MTNTGTFSSIPKRKSNSLYIVFHRLIHSLWKIFSPETEHLFFRQIAQKNICSHPAFTRRTSVRMIYRPDRTYVFYVCKARQTSDYISLILLQLSDFGRYITTTAVVRYITNIFHLYITSDISSGRFITSDISSCARAGELSLSDFFPTYI